MKNIYKWSNDLIIAEYNLILQKKSKLSFVRRQTIIHIYKTKLKAGVLPIQKEMAKKSSEIVHELIHRCISDYLKKEGFNAERAKYALSKTTLISNSEGFDVMLAGALLGEITAEFKENKHSIKFKLI